MRPRRDANEWASAREPWRAEPMERRRVSRDAAVQVRTKYNQGLARDRGLRHNAAVLAVLVALSLVGLASGPMLVALGRGRAMASAAVEGLTLGLVPALLALRLLPHVYASIGPAAMGWAAAGYVALWLADRWEHHAGARVGPAVVVPAMALHALTDGAALAVAVASRGAGGGVLALALVLHRLPEGLFLASTLVRVVGWRGTLVRIGLVGAATVVGALAGEALLDHVPEAALDSVVALGLGAMLRLVLHSHEEAPRSLRARATGGAAFAIGLAIVVLLPAGDDVLARAQPREMPVGRAFVSLFVETAPALLIGIALSLVLRVLLRAHAVTGRAGRGLLAQALRGVRSAIGPRPGACVTRASVEPGTPAAYAIATALAAPALGLDGIVLSLPLLGWTLSLLRVVAGVATALGVATVAGRFVPALRAVRVASRPPRAGVRMTASAASRDERAVATGRWSDALRDSIGSAIEPVAAWYLAGLMAGAVLEAAVAPDAARGLPAWAAVIAAALLAAGPTVSAQGAIPVAAVLVHKGFPPGAAVAWVMAATSAGAGFTRATAHAWGGRVASVVAGGTIACAVGAGLLVDAVVTRDTVPAIHPLLAHRHAQTEWVCAGFLCALLVASLLRAGPRQWLGAMRSTAT